MIFSTFGANITKRGLLEPFLGFKYPQETLGTGKIVRPDRKRSNRL